MADRAKQKNKPFKKPGHHASKSEQKNRAKGKIELQRESLKAGAKAQSRQDRKNIQKQQLQAKRRELIEKKRFGSETSPRIVAIVSLGGNVNQHEIRNRLIEAAGHTPESDTDSPMAVYSVLSQKQRMVILDVPRISTSVLDATKIADIILFAISAEDGTDDLGDHLISMIKAQGVPSVLGCLTNLDAIPEKNQHEVRRTFTKHFHFHFPGEPKFLPLQNSQDASQLLRFVCTTALKPPLWRDTRPFLLVQNVHFEASPSTTANGEETGTVKIEGYIRGAPLSANNLVHIPNFGDFQLKQIDQLKDPFPLKRHGGSSSSEGATTLEVADPAKRESLEEENPVEEMDDDLDFSDTASVSSKKIKRKLPKGTSDYQAAWILDDEGGEGSESEGEDGDGEAKMDDASDEEGNKDGEDSEEEEEEEEEDEDKNDEDEDEDEDEELDPAAIKRAKAAEYEMFPDEVDTPVDMPARERFAKYRGLKSFRSSPWDPKENLPLDYARIFQFQNFTRAKKRIVEEQQESPAKVGMYVVLHVENVPKKFFQEFDPRSAIPVVVSGLLKYERKVSVLHFVVQKHASYEAPIEAKEEMIIQCGFRSFRARPIYSHNNPNCDKHKYERFLHPGTATVATIYGPITFPPAPVLMFKERSKAPKEDEMADDGAEEDQEVMKLAATGYIQSLNPDRVVLKRILLSGHPFKIRKRTVVVRYMFFNPEDIRWFKPVELHTKLGRVGHILEPLGTHGHMKCVFDGRMMANDTILMALYKRIFPKWRAQYALPGNATEEPEATPKDSSSSSSSSKGKTKSKTRSVKFEDEERLKMDE